MEALLCPLCGREFEDADRCKPCVLPCGHSLCQSCLVCEGGQLQRCPLECSQSTHSYPVDVSYLPINVALLNMKRSLQLHHLDSAATLTLSVSQLQSLRQKLDQQLALAAERERETKRKELIAERIECCKQISLVEEEISALEHSLQSALTKKADLEIQLQSIQRSLAELHTRDGEHRDRLKQEDIITMQHIRAITETQGRYLCPLCPVACKSSMKLQNHAAADHGL